MRCIVGREDIFHERDVKRQTRLSSGSSQMSLESHGHIQLRCPSSEIVANSNCNMEYKNSESPSVAQPKSVSDQHALKGSVCCFCHSPKTTKGTGQFLYYANGKEVVENVSSPSKVICVHSKCIEWTPQVFYDGDTIKNLKSELARAAKLKCSSCGMKGAALGCYIKSCRRSYHVPCAFEIQDCRWDMYMLVTFANMCGATVCKFWKPNVTHVVAATDEKGACTRTFKVLMAILSGKWILTMDWVKACIAANGPVKEEPYEISLDNHGCSGGPKAGRLWASTNAPKLFDGFRFYLSGDFVPTYKVDLLDLVEKAGGASIQSKEQLVEQTHAAQETHPPYLVVYNCDPPRGCTFEEESNILQQRLAEAEDLAKQIGCQVIQHTWILECVAACKLVPFC
ncbi:BRCA1-associated RING domain protein 1 isoform X2 [Nicotiana tabacum]|uniref:BRCA1-associated RING domain protein 1 isoform X2 n=1 Tax=Nicotiana tabacum TaxID=4097 RepID=A0AC58T9C6_TOBAC